ncbi:chalcone isomerase family protein [Ideonella sp.]|uniref:chalcone isomerase family protein n=1 Tax=Ideonella sp. TaxID=1929293 RepID=UPI002B46D7AC|nr:chalcone isomerase family protein [Ideonella sp.]HJV68572.1 chalcone isomerase family protein [Ideonella sp.]
MKPSSMIARLLNGLLLTMALAGAATAVEIEGVKLADSTTVGGKELKLNGAGVRTRVIFKVYVMGLYLPETKRASSEVLAAEGPRRFTLSMLRNVSGADLGEAFMAGLDKNSDQAERTRLAKQIAKFGEMFKSIETLKKGDVLTGDWLPGTGTVLQLNGKPLAEPLPDVAFYNAILKIWLGDKPADSSLKPALLGEKAS